MNKPTLHWSAALTALALTIAAPAFGQESTGDAFLDAMMKDQQAEQETTSSAAAPAADPFMDAVSTKKKAAPQPVASPAGPVETRLVSAASDTRLLDEAEVVRELGPATGLFQNDSAFDGKRVAGVEFRYTGNKVLPDRRLMDVVQTRAGGE